MVINLPNFSLQKPVCRLLTVIGFLGFSGTIAYQSTMSENIDSVGTSISFLLTKDLVGLLIGV